MKRIAIVVIGLALAAVPMTTLWAGGSSEKSASGQSGAQTTIRVLEFWPDTLYPGWKPTLQDFYAQNPNIKVEWQTPGWDASTPRMQSEMLSDNPPDVIMFWHFVFNGYGSTDQLVDLKPYLQASKMSSSYFYPPALQWEDPNLNGRVYGLPDFLGPSLYFYNVDMFKQWGLQPPKTLSELISVAKALQSHGVIPVVGDWQADNIIDPLSSIQAQTAGLQPLLDVRNGKAKLQDTPSLVKAFQIYKQEVDGGVITSVAASMNQDQAIGAFVNGKAGIYQNKANSLVAVDKVRPADFHYDYFSVSYVDNPVNPYTSTFGAVWSIPQKSKNHDAAWKFLQWIWSVQWQKANVVSSPNISAVPAANSAITQPVMLSVSRNVLPKLTTDSFYMIDMVPDAVVNELDARLHQMVIGQADVDKVVAAVQVAVDKSLNK